MPEEKSLKEPVPADQQAGGARHVVCQTDEIPPGTMRSFDIDEFDIDEEEILVIHGTDGTFHVVSNECTHGEAPLDMGSLHLDRCEIECGVHGGRFNFTTGEPTAEPCELALPVYRAEVYGADLVITIED
jgi:3-phenylpropionate/trans-cinnamate dioxygenase ferredoxin component